LQAELPAIEVILPEQRTPAGQCKCLSVRQPWTWLLTHPEVVAGCGIEPKVLENRNWSTHYRGQLLLHAGAAIETNFFDHQSGLLLPDYWSWKFGKAGERLAQAMPQHRGEYATRSIVGVAELVDVVVESHSLWFVGKYGLMLAQARAIASPVVYPGSRMLFEVPDIPPLSLVREALQ
ncbi:MAG TPA: hypothetical protein VFN35_06500, partial [Ktedonobacteraceae bacterium]|nr:hypothetical protein [Ktedonobacteraceae bacterium]